MNTRRMPRNKIALRLNSPPLLLFLAIVSLAAISVSVYYEYRARQNDYLTLLEREATLFVHTVSSAVKNAIVAADNIEVKLNSRILSNLKIIDMLDQGVELSEHQLEELIHVSNVEALHVYDSKGSLRLTTARGDALNDSIPAAVVWSMLRSGIADTMLALYDYDNPKNDRLIALVARDKGGILAATVGQEEIESLKSSLGIGYFLQRFQSEENIEYIVIQNSQTIVSGSFSGYSISSFSKDPLLQRTSRDSIIQSRILEYGEQLIFETISPFTLYDQPFGVLRLGLSMAEYQGLKRDVQRRLFLLSALLIVFGLVLANFLISHRQRILLSRDLGHLQDYTNTVLENLSNGVISIDHNGMIQTINKQAKMLLELEEPDVVNRPYTSLPTILHDVIKNCFDHSLMPATGEKRWFSGKDNHRRLLTLHTNLLKGEEMPPTCILVINDSTQQSQLELHIRRNQKLTAMRDMAFSVAHEIKNPLNAVRLLIDLVEKRYKPAKDGESYSQRMATAREEINRISAIVEQYLRYSRPPTLTFSPVSFNDLGKELYILKVHQLDERNITLRVAMEDHEPAKGDRDQLKQVFINLINNSEEAIEDTGEISITGRPIDSHYEIRVRDNGKGIPEKDLDSIFNLHFTTKSEGSGIGLSVVEQIVTAHQGSIDVESELDHGTTVILRFPLEKEAGSESR